MLRYPCLVLDHDDTVVASEASVNYPCFLKSLSHFRPGAWMNHDNFSRWCFDPGFVPMLQILYSFTEEELDGEYQMWKDYALTHLPPAYPGMKELLHRHRALGGRICVVSHSSSRTILRDYREHFDLVPDRIFSWEDPASQRKPSPYPIRRIMEEFGYTGEQLLVVDDLKPGCDMARAAGVKIAYAGWGHKNAPEIAALMENWCDYSFDSMEKFTEFLFPGDMNP